MAFRYVDSSFWEDPFIEKVDASCKLVYLYLITKCQLQCGIIEVTRHRMAFDTGLDDGEISSALSVLEEAGKIAITGDYIYIRNFLKYQASSSPKVVKRIENELETISDKQELLPYIAEIRSRLSGNNNGGNECNMPPNDNGNEEVFIEFPCKQDASSTESELTYQVTASEVEKYRELYPSLDVEQELRSMLAWLQSNPTRQKTIKGIRRFITNWLNKAVDSATTREPPEQPLPEYCKEYEENMVEVENGNEENEDTTVPEF